MTTYFTSDLHLGHVNIVKYCDRPWPDVEAMNEGLIERWNDTVGARDTVYVLGDVAMGRVRENLPLVQRLNGVKILIPGNHDRCWSMYKDGAKWESKYYDAGFSSIYSIGRIEVAGQTVWLSHFPYENDERHDDSYMGFLTPQSDSWILHGHIHKSWKVKSRQINVGTDVWDYRPVSEDQIAEIIKL